MIVAVIGAGSSGLAVLNAVRGHDLDVEGFERGSDVGGLWRYQNDNGLSSAYASLRTNVSRPRMQYPSFPMPGSYGDFPGHRDMAEYLGAYADAFGLREAIRFGVTVQRLEPDRDGGWRVVLDDDSVRGFQAVVVATGTFWSPRLPDDAAGFAGEVSHSHDYRTPAPFAGRRVLVVGAGQSAAEIAVEVAGVAARTCLSMRAGAHVLPRWIGGRPYDAADVDPLNRMPWKLLNLLYRRRVARELGPLPARWPVPARRPLEGIPIVSSDLLPAVRRGEVTVKPAVERLTADPGAVRRRHRGAHRPDRRRHRVPDRPPLPGPVAAGAEGHELPLYRRIVPPWLGGLLLAGFVDAPGGLLPVVETQASWIAAVLSGRLRLPGSEGMWRAIDRGERRSRQRFPQERPTASAAIPTPTGACSRPTSAGRGGGAPPGVPTGDGTPASWHPGGGDDVTANTQPGRSARTAALGTILFVLFVGPGPVIGLVPLLLAGWTLRPPLLGWAPFRLVGVALLLLLGLPVLVDALVRFVRRGRGTPAPIAPPERLVAVGAYRYVRNPIYVAVVAMILGQALLLGSAPVLAYAAGAFLAFHLFVVLYEEPDLRRRFGDDYLAYTRKVRRWVPFIAPSRRGAARP